MQADALTLRVREGGRTVLVHGLIATGVNADGKREILGFEVTFAQDGAGVAGVLPRPGRPRPGRRGAGHLRRPPLAGHRDRRHAAGASWQRCRTHDPRDLLTKVSKASQPWVATLIRTISGQPDAAEAAAQFDRVAAALEGKLPAAATHLSGARHDLLAFTAVPREIWRQIRSSNPQERLNRELRRRTDLVGILPGRDAIIGLADAVLTEHNDEWAEARRYMGPGILAKVRASTADTTAGTLQQVNAIEAISA